MTIVEQMTDGSKLNASEKMNVGNLDEQLLKNIGQKIKTGIENIKGQISPKKEINLPGALPSKGRDLDVLRAEWSKINSDTSNMNGFGEGKSAQEHIARTMAITNAQLAIMKKFGKSQMTFGYEPVDEALFLENNIYTQLIVISPARVQGP